MFQPGFRFLKGENIIDHKWGGHSELEIQRNRHAKELSQALSSPIDETMEERHQSSSEEDLEEGLFQAQSNANVFGLVEEKKSIVD